MDKIKKWITKKNAFKLFIVLACIMLFILWRVFFFINRGYGDDQYTNYRLIKELFNGATSAWQMSHYVYIPVFIFTIPFLAFIILSLHDKLRKKLHLPLTITFVAIFAVNTLICIIAAIKLKENSFDPSFDKFLWFFALGALFFVVPYFLYFVFNQKYKLDRYLS